MYCRNCGSQMEESAKFCPSCGTSQENKELYTERISPKIEKSLSEVKTQITKGKQSGNLYKILGGFQLRSHSYLFLYYLVLLELLWGICLESMMKSMGLF